MKRIRALIMKKAPESCPIPSSVRGHSERMASVNPEASSYQTLNPLEP